ncbi:hypothetical protein BDV96DRAFT_576781 [Lophiotrema nucula]|uniref:Serine/threonine-protein kinase ppk6 n=1 Tax=Lophiotrema nucula TaxID=690887 RepID=A0A6A5Z507_9PLEO|nr:hypothetical protein BDV96DRAFT_576781 [Lophiotrema nucula]
MSADLFAAFGDEPSQQKAAPSQQQIPSTPAPAFNRFDGLTSTAPTPAPAPVPQPQPQSQAFNFEAPKPTVNDENDDWGDFEGTSSFDPPPKESSFPATQAFQVQQPSWQPAAVPKPKKPSNPNVLFDAEDQPGEDDDDDFGDFEGDETEAAAAARPGGPTGLEDLLGNMSVAHAKLPITSSKRDPDTSFDAHAPQRSPIAAFGSAVSTKQAAKAPIPPVVKQEESWDTFDDWEASIPTKAAEKKPRAPNDTIESQASVSQPMTIPPTFDEPQPGETPPTNVPPPAILLSIFPPLFSEAQSQLFKPMAAQPLPMRNKLLAEPATITYLLAYLELASVAARIIAGRKLRWKRDQHLSQGMRIGPASSRATSGMKLTGIDRSENVKEEREVADLVRAWKEQIGKLRHVVSAVNQMKAGTLGRGPDLQETMPVKTLKQAEGGIPAPQPCMLCGMKRDERVGMADQNVQDSFGEWWVDQVSMHRGCRNFWNENKDTLRQR